MRDGYKVGTLAVAFAAMASACAFAEEAKPAAFKDAGKIKSWDAWNDKGKLPSFEKVPVWDSPVRIALSNIVPLN